MFGCSLPSFLWVLANLYCFTLRDRQKIHYWNLKHRVEFPQIFYGELEKNHFVSAFVISGWLPMLPISQAIGWLILYKTPGEISKALDDRWMMVTMLGPNCGWVTNSCSKKLYLKCYFFVGEGAKILTGPVLFTIFVLLIVFVPKFFKNFCSKLLFTTFVLKFCSQLLFTTFIRTFVHNFCSKVCSQLLFTSFLQNSSSKLLLKTLIHNFL